MSCKPFPLDTFLQQMLIETGSRVWLKSKPDRFVDVIMECPWDVNLKKIIPEMLKKHDLKISGEMIIKDGKMDVPGPFQETDQLQFDDLDREIGKKLLVSGYFKTPREKGINQDKIAADLKISKPTLEVRMRKISEQALKELLGIREITKEEKIETLEFLKHASKPKKRKR